MEDYIKKYDEIIDLCDVKIREQIDGASAYKDNTLVFKVGKEVAEAYGRIRGIIPAKAYRKAVEGVQNYSENKHKAQKHEGLELFGDYMIACKDLMPAQEIIKELDVYNSINNGSIELICTKDGGYVKICAGI